MRLCARCSQPIVDGEEYGTTDIPTPSGPGPSLYFHEALCRPSPFQSPPGASVSVQEDEAAPLP